MILNTEYNYYDSPIPNWEFPKLLDNKTTSNLKCELEELYELRKKEFKIVIRKFFNFLIDFGTTERIAILKADGKPHHNKQKKPRYRKGLLFDFSLNFPNAGNYWVTSRSTCSRLSVPSKSRNFPVPFATQHRGSSAWITVSPVASLIT